MVRPAKDPSRRRRLRPATLAVASAAILLVASASWVAARLVLPTDGAPVLSDPGFAAGLAVDPVPGPDETLRRGDTVVGVNGAAVDGWLRGGPSLPTPSLRAGAVLLYYLRRDGRTETVSVTLRRGTALARQLRDLSLPLVAGGALVALGGFCVRRRPDELAAQALVLFGAGIVGDAAFHDLGPDVSWVVGASHLAAVGAAAAALSRMLWLAALAVIALTFPPARRRARRAGAVVGGLYALAPVTAAVVLLVAATGHASLSSLDHLGAASDAAYIALAVLTVGGLAVTALRARRDERVRRQAALVGIGVAVTVVTLTVGNVIAGDRTWPGWARALVVVPLPAAAALAILRGELFDIRATLSRALVYGALTVALLALYGAGVAVVAFIAGDAGLVATVPATGLVAVAFAPLRERLQRAVDRLFYGARGDPQRALGALGRRLEAALPPEQVLATIAETVAETLRLPYVAIATVSDGAGSRVACERGEPPAERAAIRLVYQGRPVGELVVGARRGERSVSDADRDVLGSVARQVAAAVNGASLLTDLAASRRALAVEREHERARVRHDLHDRLASHLVGLSLQLDSLADAALAKGLHDPLRDAQLQAERALEEVRRISRGLGPADLDELGLLAAISAAAARLTIGDDGRGWRASVESAVQLPHIPAEVESAAYQIAVEALTNAYRHSGGTYAHARVGVDARGRVLTVEVADDGEGISADAAMGVGLQSMRSRATKAGGRLAVCPRDGKGTVVRAELPLGPLSDDIAEAARS